MGINMGLLNKYINGKTDYLVLSVMQRKL